MGTKQSSLELCCDSQALKDKYSFQNSHVLVHKETCQVCTLHQIGANNDDEAENIQQNINKYKASQCQSIMKVRQSFYSTNSEYCSNNKFYYLIFEGHSGPNVKQEYLERRLLGEKFDDGEIEAVLSCMLCGLRQYHKEFERLNYWISLSSVLINKQDQNALVLKDPWLVEHQIHNSSAPINFLANYPSPEKIMMQGNQQSQLIENYSQFQSELFSIGVLGLQLKVMNYTDDVYAHKKFVDGNKISEYLSSIPNPRLRRGLAILLHQKASQRTLIYDFWRVSCLTKYCLRHNHANVSVQTLQTEASRRVTQQSTHFMHPFNAQKIEVKPYRNNNSTGIESSVSRHTEYRYQTPTVRDQSLLLNRFDVPSHAKPPINYPMPFQHPGYSQGIVAPVKPLPINLQESNTGPVYFEPVSNRSYSQQGRPPRPNSNGN